MTNPKVTAAMQWNVEGDVYRAVYGAVDRPWINLGVVHGALGMRRAGSRAVYIAVELAANWSYDLCALQDFLRETKSSCEGRE